MSVARAFALRTGRGVIALTGCAARRTFFADFGANIRNSIPIVSSF
ncbi:MAG: hypothetical protein WB507_11320 [Solirubrobacterales bacterium]